MPTSTRSSPVAEGAGSLWVVILAGGSGSRFWPLSTTDRPKQVLPLADDRPMVAETLRRARLLVPDERIRVLAGDHLQGPLRAALPDLHESGYLVEPAAKGTAPVLAWASHAIAALDPGAIVVSLHADHVIRPDERFVEAIQAAVAVAREERLLMTVGARPDRPETGYGYIEPGEAVGSGGQRVSSFHEKPDEATARAYLERGFLWNTGIFVWAASAFLEEVSRRAPEIGPHLHLLDEGEAAGFFAAVPARTVDVAVLERSDRVGVVPAPFDWDDVGAWHSLHRVRAADPAGNVLIGEGLIVEGSGNVVYAEGEPVVLFGVDDLVAVRTGGVTMVTSKRRSAELKRLLDQLPDTLRSP